MGVPISPGTADMSMDWNQKIIAAVREFERGRIVLDGYDYGVTPTGEPFVKIVTGEVVAEGEDEPFSSTPEDAIQRWFDGVTKWAEDKSGTLYWRIRPSVECSYDGRWKVYSRLLISDKPVIDGVIDVAKEEASRLCKSREELLQLPSTPMYHDFKVRRDRFRQDNKDGIGLHSVNNPMPGDEQILTDQEANGLVFDRVPAPKDEPFEAQQARYEAAGKVGIRNCKNDLGGNCPECNVADGEYHAAICEAPERFYGVPPSAATAESENDPANPNVAPATFADAMSKGIREGVKVSIDDYVSAPKDAPLLEALKRQREKDGF